MPNLHDIDRRINSVKSTKQITRTMEMIAAAKIRKARERVETTIPYTQGMAVTVSRVVDRLGDSNNPLLKVHDEVKRVLIVSVVSDRGLAGGFNGNVLRASERIIKQKKAQGAECDVIACGKKAISYFRYRQIDPIMEFAGLSEEPTMGEAIQLGNFAMEKYADGTYDEVILVYNHARNAGDQVLRAEYLLPVRRVVFVDAYKAIPNWLAPMSAFVSTMDLDYLKKIASGADASEADEQVIEPDLEFEPSQEEVLWTMMPAYMRTMFYQTLIDSAAGEQGARRNAMKAATDNANEIEINLTRLYNRVRQGAITTEINEIVGGAAALED
ncbi:MAG: ATP synthase F1 subunit gamma [Eggerthellales bacterium]|nr:ATP synthase F1 subunit gamma [Eggerthellales bacterium]